ncbi:hypothetical protein [Bradyrhizobium sp. ERR14]|uniref:hypothetical protein n=1 Tax=Bradyrhizobium sp. ERR14 TaxID=2663837 RepID=UPI001622F9F5|nr:hypothetical protein [Bradyrhizobium sp. ERR14]MBB4395068.1 hypothetical protein [Bradyrhizobium sp. ERR14]
MSPFVSNVLFLSVLTALLVPVKKWAEMNPYRIEDGPSWVMASVSALYTMALFVLAIASEAQGSTRAAAFFGSFAFGSAIGGCFLTQFKRSPDEVPNPLLRWWMSKLDGMADGLFKSFFVVPAGWLISWLTPFNGRFWSASVLALALVSAKTGVAMLTLHSETSDALRKARERMLIGGSILLTMVVGIVCLLFWLGLARSIIQSFPPFEAHDWIGLFGFVLGVMFHSL